MDRPRHMQWYFWDTPRYGYGNTLDTYRGTVMVHISQNIQTGTRVATYGYTLDTPSYRYGYTWGTPRDRYGYTWFTKRDRCGYNWAFLETG